MVVGAWYTTANRVSDRSICLFGLNAQLSFLLADFAPLVLAGTAFTWVVNRPLEYVGWLIIDYGGLALVAIGAAALYAVGFLLALLTHTGAPPEERRPRVQWVRDGIAWVLCRADCGQGSLVRGNRIFALPDVMTLVPADCIGEVAACAAGQGVPTGR